MKTTEGIIPQCCIYSVHMEHFLLPSGFTLSCRYSAGFCKREQREKLWIINPPCIFSSGGLTCSRSWDSIPPQWSLPEQTLQVPVTWWHHEDPISLGGLFWNSLQCSRPTACPLASGMVPSGLLSSLTETSWLCLPQRNLPSLEPSISPLLPSPPHPDCRGVTELHHLSIPAEVPSSSSSWGWNTGSRTASQSRQEGDGHRGQSLLISIFILRMQQPSSTQRGFPFLSSELCGGTFSSECRGNTKFWWEVQAPNKSADHLGHIETLLHGKGWTWRGFRWGGISPRIRLCGAHYQKMIMIITVIIIITCTVEWVQESREKSHLLTKPYTN